MSDHTILFVDDDPDILRLLSSHFERLGHRVHAASTGEEGIAMYRRFGPDVTVLDLVLPDMSGLDVLRVLRDDRAMVIMLTGHDDVAAAVEAMRLGAENFLQKGFDLTHLQMAVEKAAEKGTLVTVNRRLEARLRPSLGRRLKSAGMMAVLLGAAIGIGHAIGRSEQADRPLPRMAVPPDDGDTVKPESWVPGSGAPGAAPN